MTNADPDNRLDSAHLIVLLASLGGFTGLSVWLYSVGTRIEKIRHRRRQEVLLMSDLTGIMAVTMIIWIGLFAYVYRLDRKVSRMED